MTPELKLPEISRRILVHLQRFEADLKINKPKPGSMLRPYYRPNAGHAGAYVFVKYISYQGYTFLSKAHALAYLAWLDAGNVGKHHAVPAKAPA